MRSNRIRTTGLVTAAFVATLFGVIAVSAQDASQDTGPRGALPGPNATPPGADQHSKDGTNFAQPVPGAMPGSDTIPSTMSERSAADDEPITVAFTFRHLTAAQRNAILEGLKDKPAATTPDMKLGAELPATIELGTMPDEIVARVPDTKGYQYAVTRNRVFLVSPANRIVVAEIDSTTTSQGQPPAAR